MAYVAAGNPIKKKLQYVQAHSYNNVERLKRKQRETYKLNSYTL